MALCPPEISGWAAQILDSLPDTGNTSVPKIYTWLTSNLYKLNAAIYTDYYVGESGCIVPTGMTPFQSGVYNQFFYCSWLKEQSIRNLGAAGYSVVEAEGHDIGRVRYASRTTISDGYRLESKACNEELQALIDWYNSQNALTPSVGMVIYDCRGPNFGLFPAYGECFPKTEYFGRCNPYFC